jgi:LacI family transcriptional regulator
MAKGKRITIIDVAREAGVSAGTVSRAMNNSAKVNPTIHRRIMNVIERLGYEPNSFAQNLRGQVMRTVGCLVSDLSNPLHGVFLTAVEQRLHAAGLMMVVANSHNLEQREREAISLFRRRRVDGLILTFGDERSEVVRQVLPRIDSPVVILDRDVAQPKQCDLIQVDHRTGAYQATKHLLELGHRRIALLTPPPTIWPGRERIAGFRAAHEQAGAKVDEKLIRILDAATPLAYSEAKEIIGANSPPTAIICLGTQMLSGVVSALSSAFMKIPEDISLIGIGDTDLVRLHSPPITTVRWDIPALGRMAAEMLLSRLDGTTTAEPRRVMFPTEFVQRASCTQPRRGKSTTSA